MAWHGSSAFRSPRHQRSRSWAAAAPRHIDSGRIDDATWFFNVAGVGLDALIARHIARPDAQRGLSGYTRVTFWELPRYRSEPYRIEWSGRTEQHRALFIAFANSRQYGNGAQIAPGARLDDGRLDLVVVDAQPLWRIVSRIPDLFRGGSNRVAACTCTR